MGRNFLACCLILTWGNGCSSDVKVGVFNAEPTVTITSHQDGMVVTAGTPVILTGVVSDPDGDAESMTVAWTMDGADACTDAVPDEVGNTYCPWTFSEGGGNVQLQVWDLGGASAAHSIKLSVGRNEAPVAEILSPTDSGTYYTDQLLVFEGQMSDHEDQPGQLTGHWKSSLDGDLALNETPDASGVVLDFAQLSQGNHAITFTATDLGGKTGSDSLVIQVGPPNSPPSCAIMSPTAGLTSELGAAVAFTGVVGDPDISPDQLLISWTSDVDGLLANSLARSSGDVSFVTANLSAAVHTVTLSVKDELGLTCSDSVTFTVGAPPSVVITTPTNLTVSELGDVISFKANVADAEDSASDLSLVWESDLDGVLSTDGAGSNGLAQFNDSDLSAGTHTVTLTVTDSSGLFAKDLVSLSVVPNSPPSIASVSITPNPAYSDDVLACSYSGYSDLEGDPDRSTFEWTVGGAVVGTGPSLSAGFAKGDLVTCAVTPFDGKGFGTPVSASLTISNRVPSVSAVTLSPTPAHHGDVITCSYSGFFDADGDSDRSEIVWMVNGVSPGTGSVLSLGVDKGDVVQCTVTPHDGTSSGAPVSASLIVSNSAPSASNVSITPDPAYPNDTLTCSYQFDDLDGDADLSGIGWSVGGVMVGSGPTLSGSFGKGDVVTCTVTPSDGALNGAPVSDSVVIENSIPTVSNVVVAPDPATASDQLTCSYLFQDVDGDADQSTVVWTKNGLVIGLGATLSSGFARGDTVRCTVTPFDGSVSGVPGSDELVIGNALPLAASVQITPNPATVSDSLSCSYAFSDADGDADQSLVNWSVGGAPLGNALVLGAGVAKKGDSVTCTVTPYDGLDFGAPVSDTLVVGNEAPVVSVVTVTSTTDFDGDADETTAVAGDSLTCSYQFSDGDGDIDASSVAWTVDGVSAGSGATLNGVYTRGQTVTCTVTPHDGTATGTPESGDMVISNSAPSVANVGVQPNPATALDTLTCSYSFSDPDGDADASVVDWTVNGAASGTGLTLVSSVAAGDVVGCTVTPRDASLTGAPMSASLVVQNMAPTVSNVSVTSSTDADGDGDPTTAVAADTLLCNYHFSDLDGHGDSSTVAWTVGGVNVGTGATLATGFAKGDTVTCTVTPFDGLSSGTPVSGSLLVGNEPPTVSGVSVTSMTNVDGDNNNLTAVVGDTLSCAYTFADPDGDPDTSSISWSVGGQVVGTAASLSGAFAKGDTVQCTVTPNDGNRSGVPMSASIVVGNTTPSVLNVSVSPNPANASDVLTCNYTFVDTDNDSDNSTVEWTVGGLAAGSGATLSGAFAAGDTVVCTVTPNDGTTSGAPASDSVVIANQPPSVSQVTVTSSTDRDGDGDPTTAVATDTLVCSYTFYDADGGADQSSVVWSVGGLSVGTGTSLSGVFVKGDTVSCTVTPNDGSSSGAPNSDAMLIDNQVPYAQGATLTAVTDADGDNNPATAVAADTLECGYNFVDEDGDGDASTIQWDVNGSFVGTGLNLSGLFVKNDVVTCKITPNDGSVSGTPVTASLVIGNGAPSVSNVAITPKPAFAQDTLTCGYTFSDSDLADADLSVVSWSVEGVPAGVGMTLSGVFGVGDTVSCSVLPSDGSVTGAPVTDSVVISNRVPSVSQVSVQTTTDADGDGDPLTAVASDSLSCTYTFSDLDADPDLSAIDWYVQGTKVGTGANLSGVFAKGDTVTCSVTPGDGVDFGTPMDAFITIGNQTPSLGSVSVTATTNFDGDGDANTAVASDELTCSYVFSDGDNDSDVSTLQWLVNGTVVGSGTNLSGFFQKDDVVTCTVTPRDGTDVGSPMSDSMVIDSEAPSVSSVYITPNPAEVSDLLTCHYTFTDPDWDADQSTVAWTIQGALVGTGVTLSGAFSAGDTVLCTVTPRDATTVGTPVSASVYIEAEVPMVANVRIEPNPPTDADVLECSYDFISTSGGSDESHISWYVNGYRLEDQVMLGSAYSYHCAIDVNGVTQCWGADSMGQASAPNKTFRDVSGSQMYTCGVDTGYRLECWGFDNGGVLTPPSGYYKKVSVGTNHGCAITNADTITCWGNNTDGQQNKPTGTFSQITSRNNHSCALGMNGDVTCWGDNASGQTNVPQGVKFLSVSTGVSHTCGVEQGGSILCWGSSSQGQQTHPTTGTFTKVTTYDDHSCALDSDGAIHCWGRDLFSYGTLSGVPQSKGHIDVSTGFSHSCAIDENGAITCWGDDSHGQVSGSPAPLQEDGFLYGGFEEGDVVWCEVTADDGTMVGNTQSSGAVTVMPSVPNAADTCADLVNEPYLRSGSYAWTIDNYTETVSLPAANLCTGWYSGGPDALFRVKLDPGETLDLALEVTSDTGYVYDAQVALINGCNDTWSSTQWLSQCETGEDTLNSPELMSYQNQTGATQELVLVLTKRWSTSGVHHLAADVDIY